ncbi:hypothetical protein AVEN_275336-1 [Araneus ventricosus]|uniref:Uncharacterized protein n=1 Tax=Araneus ventricosus TaxID=182803 RepID=A0A4Y2KWP6_ARAVE|nr:hypothetical protein AVEN_275336-1 [Araneus ventricosus]
MLATWQMAWDDGDTGRLIHNIIPNQSTGHTTKFCFSQDMRLSLRFSEDSTLPKPHSVLVGETAHQSIMLRFASSQPPTIYGTTQPTTSASMVTQRSQQLNVKKEDT